MVHIIARAKTKCKCLEKRCAKEGSVFAVDFVFVGAHIGIAVTLQSPLHIAIVAVFNFIGHVCGRGPDILPNIIALIDIGFTLNKIIAVLGKRLSALLTSGHASHIMNLTNGDPGQLT